MRAIHHIADSTTISEASKCYVIAEAGVNHNGDLGFAKELVYAAHQSGADVKFQAFVPELLAHRHASKAGYQLANTGQVGQLYAGSPCTSLENLQYS